MDHGFLKCFYAFQNFVEMFQKHPLNFLGHFCLSKMEPYNGILCKIKDCILLRKKSEKYTLIHRKKYPFR